MSIKNRENTICLDGLWDFCLDPGDEGIDMHWPLNPPREIDTIMVPGNANASGFGGEGFAGHFVSYGATPKAGRSKYNKISGAYYGPMWYFKRVKLGEHFPGNRIFLKFKGAQPHIMAWVNGLFVGSSFGSGLGFLFDITYAADNCDEIFLAIRIDSSPENVIFISHSNIYLAWGGISDSISIESVPPLYLGNLKITPDLANSRILAESEAEGDLSGVKNGFFRVRVLDEKGETVSENFKAVSDFVHDEAQQTLDISVGVPGCKMWELDSPCLYTAEARLEDGEGNTVHAISSRFGMRSISVEGRRLLLNGRPILMYGMHFAWDFLDTISPPADKEWYRRYYSRMKEYGFNYLRTPWIIPQAGLDAADEVGILLQIDMDYVSGRIKGSNLEKDLRISILRDLIAQYYNHPSFVTYCLCNENWYQSKEANRDNRIYNFYYYPIPMEAYQYVRKADRTRLVIDSDGVFGKYRQTCDIWTPHIHVPRISYEEYLGKVLYKDFESDKYPVVIHEYINTPTFFDYKGAERYTGPVRAPEQLIELGSWMQANGLTDKSDSWLNASYKLQRLYIKAGLEAVRKHPYLCGYSMCAWKDLCVQEVAWGICDVFGQPKAMAAEEFRRYNSDFAVFADLPGRNGSLDDEACALPSFVYRAETEFHVRLKASNYRGELFSGGKLDWQLSCGNDILSEGCIEDVLCEIYEVKEFEEIFFTLPPIDEPCKAVLSVCLSNGSILAENEWEIWIFPGDSSGLIQQLEGVYADGGIHEKLAALGVGLVPQGSLTALLISDDAKSAVEYAGKGGNALLVSSDIGNYYAYQKGLYPGWFEFHGYHLGSTVEDHPSLGAFPHDGYAAWQFRSMLRGGYPFTGGSLSIEPVIHGPVVTKNGATLADLGYIAVAPLFQTGVGKGRLLVCTLDVLNGTPEGTYLLCELIGYAAGDFTCKTHNTVQDAHLALVCK